MTLHPLMHPALAETVYKQRQAELMAEASAFRVGASQKTPNKVERFFVKRREGKVTWIETVLVQRSA